MDPNSNYMGNFGFPYANYGGMYFPVYNNEMETEADLRFMKEMYPEAAKEIQALVEQELDNLDYEGSIIYDEYPDRVQLYRIVSRIYDRALMGMNGNRMNWESGMNAGNRVDREGGMNTGNRMNFEGGMNTGNRMSFEGGMNAGNRVDREEGMNTGNSMNRENEMNPENRMVTDSDRNRETFGNNMGGMNMNNNIRQQWGQCFGENCRDRRLEEFIYVILLNEMFKRRADRRNNRRRYW